MGDVDLDAPLRSARPRSAQSTPPSSVPSQAGSSNASSADPLLQRRLVTVQEYADELRRGTKLASFGASVAPVPVVLAPGETEEQYEAKFIAWLRTERSLTLADLKHDTNRERTLRISFATRITREAESSCSRSSSSQRNQKENYVSRDGRVDFANLPRRLLLVHEYMSLEQFRRDSRRGRFTQIAQFSFKEKQRLFGSPYAPIYVPLAPGETKEQYEARFIEWLAAKRGMTLAQLENHPNHVHERFLRLQFAALNGKGQLQFEPPRKRDRSASDGPDESLSAALKRAKQACTGKDSVAACRACGCRQCLLAAMRQLATTITSLETKANALECPTSETSTTATVIAARPDCEREPEETDHVEQQLLEEYDSINEMIVMNESALDASAAEIVKLARTDAAEATLRRDEDLELRVMVEEESERRRVALAMVVVYMYRHDIGELEAIVDPTQTADVVHVQKLSHHTCARLAVEITEMRAQVVDAESKTDEIPAKLRRLLTQRRRELTTVVRFDQRVRELIRTLLTRAQCQ